MSYSGAQSCRSLCISRRALRTQRRCRTTCSQNQFENVKLFLQTDAKVAGFKTGVIAAVAGSLCCAPPAILLDATRFSAQWEYDIDMLAVALFLFGPVYRVIAIPPASDAKQGVHINQGLVLAFVIVHATSLVRVDAACSPIPLDCGAPLGYLSWGMLDQMGSKLLEGSVAFAGAALAMERCFELGWVSRREWQSPSSAEASAAAGPAAATSGAEGQGGENQGEEAGAAASRDKKKR